ncbi:MAG TPA: hypothetical protein VJW93_11480 [Candidatus Acidoferrales bacterium]|nr:hypothetical protein [Candidatus Acidoferrales bacterium]
MSPKARWGQAAAIAEMPNQIAISTHRPEEKCRSMGSLCHTQHGPSLKTGVVGSYGGAAPLTPRRRALGRCRKEDE